MIAALRRFWHRRQRWQRADRLGWGLFGTILTLRERDAHSFRADWLVRNANRLYRLTRGHGNPWRD